MAIFHNSWWDEESDMLCYQRERVLNGFSHRCRLKLIEFDAKINVLLHDCIILFLYFRRQLSSLSIKVFRKKFLCKFSHLMMSELINIWRRSNKSRKMLISRFTWLSHVTIGLVTFNGTLFLDVEIINRWLRQAKKFFVCYVISLRYKKLACNVLKTQT